MATVTHEIGKTLDISKGTFVNTVYDEVDEVLRLVKEGYYDTDGNFVEIKDDALNTLYKKSGTWTSEIIDMGDKFTDFKNVVKTVAVSGSYKIFTKSSSDKTTWSSWEEVDTSFTIMSATNRYIQVKVEFYGLLNDSEFTFEKFNDESKFSNEYVELDSGNLKLKKNYQYSMDKDSSWSGEGTLFRKTIQKTKFKKIDSLNHI